MVDSCSTHDEKVGLLFSQCINFIEIETTFATSANMNQGKVGFKCSKSCQPVRCLPPPPGPGGGKSGSSFCTQFVLMYVTRQLKLYKCTVPVAASVYSCCHIVAWCLVRHCVRCSARNVSSVQIVWR